MKILILTLVLLALAPLDASGSKVVDVMLKGSLQASIQLRPCSAPAKYQIVILADLGDAVVVSNPIHIANAPCGKSDVNARFYWSFTGWGDEFTIRVELQLICGPDVVIRTSAPLEHLDNGIVTARFGPIGSCPS